MAGKPKVATCCCCGQVLPPRIVLPKITGRIYNFVAAHPEGVDTATIAEHVYADDPEGGPEYALTSIHTLICKLNRKYLIGLGVRIKGSGGPGSTYRLIPA